MKTVLVTSSTGLTGHTVVRNLACNGARVRAMIHSEKHKARMLSLGAAETVTASIDSPDDLKRAMNGVDTVFYICPTAHPAEGEIGATAIDIACRQGVRRFVYQSVHNSIEPTLIHHRQKLMVEQHLLESALAYTILRPAAFMQNLLSDLSQIRERHCFTQRFYTGLDTDNRINLIDADDYGEIAAKITLDDEFIYAQFDLCGPHNLSAKDMIHALSKAIGSEISLSYISDEDFMKIAMSHKMPAHTLEVLLTMFRAYNRFGFAGNPSEATLLLGRKPTDFMTFVNRALAAV